MNRKNVTYDPGIDATRFRTFSNIYGTREQKDKTEKAEKTQNLLIKGQALAIPLRLMEDHRRNTALEVAAKKQLKSPDTVSGLMYEEIPYEAPDRAKFDPRQLMDKFNERYRGVDQRLRLAELKGVASTGSMGFEMPGAEMAQQNLQSYATRLTGEAPPMSFGAQPQMFGGKGLSSATPLYEPNPKELDFSTAKMNEQTFRYLPNQDIKRNDRLPWKSYNVNTAPSASQSLLDSSASEVRSNPRIEGGIKRSIGMDMPFKTQKEGFGQIKKAFPDDLKNIRRSSEGLSIPKSVKTPQDPGFKPLASGTKANPIPLAGVEVTADAGSVAGEATKSTPIGGALGAAGAAKSLYDIASSDATGGNKLKAVGETGLDYASSAVIASGSPLAGAGVAYKGGKILWDLLT